VNVYLQFLYSGHGVSFAEVTKGGVRKISDTHALHADGASYTNVSKLIRTWGAIPHVQTMGFVDCCRLTLQDSDFAKPKGDMNGVFDGDETPNTNGNYTIVYACKDGTAAFADSAGGRSRMTGHILGFFDT